MLILLSDPREIHCEIHKKRRNKKKKKRKSEREKDAMASAVTSSERQRPERTKRAPKRDHFEASDGDVRRVSSNIHVFLKLAFLCASKVAFFFFLRLLHLGGRDVTPRTSPNGKGETWTVYFRALIFYPARDKTKASVLLARAFAEVSWEEKK